MRKLLFIILGLILITTVVSYLFFSGTSGGYVGGMLAPVVPLMGFGP